MARKAMDEAIEQQTLIPLDKEKGMFTSAIHLLDELSLQQLAGQMKDSVTVPVLNSAPARGRPVMQQIAAQRPALVIITQPGGAAALRENVVGAVEMAQTQGRSAIVLATDKASGRWLDSQEGLAGKVIRLSDLAQTPLAPGSTLVVAGAEKLAVRDALSVMDASLRGGVQVMMLDSGGRGGTGNALQTLEAAGIPRHPSAPDRRVDVSIRSVPDKRERYAALAQDYARLREHGEVVVAQVSGEREINALTTDIRSALREHGQLAEKSVTVSTLVPQWLDSKNRRQLDTYQEGMVMEQRTENSSVPARYTVDRVSPATRTLTLRDGQGGMQSLKLSALDSCWSLYRPETVEVAAGEQLTWLARQGKYRAGDTVTVTKVHQRAIEAEINGRTQMIHTDEPLKAGYGYVTTPGARMSERGVVLAAVSGSNTRAPVLNTLARSGEQVNMYTPLSQDEATRKLARSPLYRTALEQVNPQGQALDTALNSARDNLMSTGEKAVRQAVTLAQGSEVIFSRPDVMARALPLHPQITKAHVDAALSAQIKAGELIAVPGVKGAAQQLFITAASYDAEKRLIQLVAQGLDTQAPLLRNADPALFTGLTAGQQAAAMLMLESSDRFIGIQGYAGVGKTTQLKSVIAALDTLPADQKPEVVGLAPTHRAVGEMNEVGVKSQTLARFLMDTERRMQGGERPDFSKTLFLVDESSMVGNLDFADAMSRIAAGGGRAVLSGDRDQLLSVSSGAPFSLMQSRSALDTAIMKDIVRQTPALKPAVYALIERQVPAALETVRAQTPDIVPRTEGRWSPVASVMEIKQTREQREQEGDRVIQAIVTDFTGRTPDARAQTLIVTQTNDDKNAINRGVHDALSARGELGRSTTVSILDRVKTQPDRLKSVAGMAEQAGNIALINDRYYTIRAGQDSQKNGYVELVDDRGQAQVLSAFESSLRDVAVFSPRNITVSVGEKISFSRADKERGREANSHWTVSALTRDGDVHLSRGDDTRVLNPGDEMADRHIDYGYAGTAHKAQGASEKFVVMLAGVSSGRQALATLRDAYVALSRAKEHVQIYSDDLSKWESNLSRSEDRKTAHDILHVDADRQAAAAQGLWDNAKVPEDTALGRALVREFGNTGEARFVNGTHKYPAPHLAWPVFNDAGKLQALLLSEVWLGSEGTLDGISPSTRRFGSETGTNIVVRRSENGVTQMVTTLQEGRELAASMPEMGVVVVSGERPADRILRSLTGGIPLPVAEATAPAGNPTTTDIPDPLSQKTPEEQAVDKAIRDEARERANKDEGIRIPEPSRDATEKESAREIVRETEREQRLQEKDIHDATALQKQHNQQEQLRQLEREIVKEKIPGE
ncbi:TraI family protein [Buttiauxella sp. B2]|uniref:AAA family ATPase n=1 Tax=Buttiauxella sp. B2 TaxID=2587812 RepID=UPI0011232DF3|nr:AAA family ATPase [Buttiauxella sp. B2]TNV10475.1 TraI family protein [Buttiauxella sp. B2]